MTPQFVIEHLEKYMVKLYYQKRTDLYSLCSKHAPERYARYSSRQKIPERTRWEVWKRDLFTCVYCLDQDAILTLDHVVPTRLDGDYSPDNLVTACGPCNHRKGSRDVKEFLEGTWLRKKRKLNLKHISTTKATQVQSHLNHLLAHTSKTIGERLS